MITGYGLINERAPHLLADLAEIVSYFEEKEFSRGDVESLIRNYSGVGLLEELTVRATPGGSVESAESVEKLQLLTEEVFQNLFYRARAFKDWYPFEVDHDVLCPKGVQVQKHRVYAALLSYSRLKMFDQAECSKFAMDFERLCATATKYLFKDWTVLHFGVGGTDRALFGTKLRDSLTKLGERFCDELTSEVASIPDNNCGDGGIDIVVLSEWSDVARGRPGYLGQCAAQQVEWPAKKFESNWQAMSRWFSFFHNPGVLLFIPVCYRTTAGKWIDGEGYGTVLIDRLRLTELLSKSSPADEELLGNFCAPFPLGCGRKPVSKTRIAKAAAKIKRRKRKAAKRKS